MHLQYQQKFKVTIDQPNCDTCLTNQLRRIWRRAKIRITFVAPKEGREYPVIVVETYRHFTTRMMRRWLPLALLVLTVLVGIW
jgi:ribosomal protein L39E